MNPREEPYSSPGGPGRGKRARGTLYIALVYNSAVGPYQDSLGPTLPPALPLSPPLPPVPSHAPSPTTHHMPPPLPMAWLELFVTRSKLDCAKLFELFELDCAVVKR